MLALKIGISLPTISQIETLGIGGLSTYARHIEQLGLDSVWMPDLIIGDGTPSLESIVALATAARLRIGSTSGSVSSSFPCAQLPGSPRRSRRSNTSQGTASSLESGLDLRTSQISPS